MWRHAESKFQEMRLRDDCSMFMIGMVILCVMRRVCQDSRGFCAPRSYTHGTLKPGNEARDIERLTRDGLVSSIEFFIIVWQCFLCAMSVALQASCAHIA